MSLILPIGMKDPFWGSIDPLVGRIKQIEPCTGGCCKKFYLPFFRSNADIEDFKQNGTAEQRQVAEMVISHEGSRCGEIYYSCTHFKENEGCTIYKDRPFKGSRMQLLVSSKDVHVK